MSDYLEPGVTYQKLPSPRSLLIPGGIADVAFVGTSKTTKIITDEVVTRGGSGETDTLSATTVASLTKIYDENGVLYFLTTDYTLTAPNKVDWTPAGNEPVAGVKYYVTYEVDKVSTDYDVKTVYSMDEVIQEYGAVSSTNILALAAQLFFDNGGVKLKMVQSTGTDLTTFIAAVDKLAVEEVDVLVPLQTNGTGFDTLFSQIKGRIFQLSQPIEGHERMAFFAPATGTSIANYKILAVSMKFERIVVTAPPVVTKTIDDVTYTLPGYFVNAAMAGFLADPDNSVAEPLTRKEIFGFDSLGTKYTRSQIRDLISNGVLVVEQIDSLIRVVQGITTDRTSTDTGEISLVRVEDFFGKTLKSVLDQIYIGTLIDATALSSITSTITTVIENFISKGILVAYTDLSVTQNRLNPTAIDVFMRLQPVYPLNYINIRFTFGLL